MFVISITILMNEVTYSYPNAINNILMSVKQNNFPLVFLSLFTMLILVQQESKEGLVYIFQCRSSKSSETHKLTKMYDFEDTNHDNYLNSLFQNLYRRFLCVCNVHQKYLPYLSNYKNIILFWQ